MTTFHLSQLSHTLPALLTADVAQALVPAASTLVSTHGEHSPPQD